MLARKAAASAIRSRTLEPNIDPFERRTTWLGAARLRPASSGQARLADHGGAAGKLGHGHGRRVARSGPASSTQTRGRGLATTRLDLPQKTRRGGNVDSGDGDKGLRTTRLGGKFLDIWYAAVHLQEAKGGSGVAALLVVKRATATVEASIPSTRKQSQHKHGQWRRGKR
ncbi:uncharacterized protein LOC112877612 isoform X2 [Panicum hallii]|uniref:uncharacterized protein LOC112877612 isoform X2 n=1 Tax=Panicum hallii TaxID=206008 RepID=UPI000DF4E7D4|nr:uncharacterized protein LOC112877612 isoform X2 [Panicum hallii]